MAGGSWRNLDVSDETSGLPPLADVRSESTLAAFAFDVSQEGFAWFTEDAADGTTRILEEMPALIYLSLRGWTSPTGDHATSSWRQIHVGIPRELIPQIVGALYAALVFGGIPPTEDGST
jgi:hypothetical protein